MILLKGEQKGNRLLKINFLGAGCVTWLVESLPSMSISFPGPHEPGMVVHI